MEAFVSDVQALITFVKLHDIKAFVPLLVKVLFSRWNGALYVHSQLTVKSTYTIMNDDTDFIEYTRW